MFCIKCNLTITTIEGADQNWSQYRDGRIAETLMRKHAVFKMSLLGLIKHGRNCEVDV